MSRQAQPISDRLELTISSDPAEIAAVRHAVEGFASSAGLDDRAVADVGLCVNEALANVIRHAYAGQRGRPIAIAAQGEDGEVTVTIRDWGNGVNPASLPPRPYDPLEPGGLGLICLRDMLSEVSYVPQKDGMLLVMKQRNHKPGGAVKSAPGARQ